jgi:hypothetical protein
MRLTYEELKLPSGCLRPVDDCFHGVIPGVSSKPVGKIDLLAVSIGHGDNKRKEELAFEDKTS